MLEKQDLNQSLIGSEFSKTPHVVSEFDIRNFHYLVVFVGRVIERSRLEKSLSAFLSTLDISIFSEVDRFKVNDQLCVIVETDSADTHSECDLPGLLTDRELQIAALVAQGRPNKQIAKQLHISEWTVATHLRRIFAKLNVDSRAAMVYRCADWIHQWQTLEVIET
ncbi:MAG: helix-turn-helix transcriptional regulator [Leptolyngbyaceae cyanobacterium MO_188.B28]|nr:helix-turn-helix transcriptional regulator [Leptolyngbyaceae cyanobacterium MO_188.B28]